MKKIALIVVLVILWSVSPSVASSDTVYYGCLDCEYDNFVTIPTDSCEQVGDNETGWTKCRITKLVGNRCYLEGGACLNTEVCVGNCGGPGWGGGGDDECSIGPSEYCPVSCPSCTLHY